MILRRWFSIEVFLIVINVHSNDHYVRYITKYEFYDLKPFITYIYYKLAELENVRIVMVGLINNIEKNEIEKRLRAGYEG